MQDFKFHQPKSFNKAASLVIESDDAVFMAGGQTLIPTMKQRLATPEDVVDLTQIRDFGKIEQKGRRIIINAGATHASVAASEVVRENLPALADLASGIGDPQVRNRGTIGGSIANNDPTADYPAACLGLGATIKTNMRKIEAEDFFVGLFETALEEGEIVQSITFPIISKSNYQKLPNPASRYAIVGVFVSKKGKNIRVAITGAGSDGVYRDEKLEQILSGSFRPKALDGVTVSPDDLSSDIHASAQYRASAIVALTKRAVIAA